MNKKKITRNKYSRKKINKNNKSKKNLNKSKRSNIKYNDSKKLTGGTSSQSRNKKITTNIRDFYAIKEKNKYEPLIGEFINLEIKINRLLQEQQENLRKIENITKAKNPREKLVILNERIRINNEIEVTEKKLKETMEEIEKGIQNGNIEEEERVVFSSINSEDEVQGEGQGEGEGEGEEEGEEEEVVVPTLMFGLPRIENGDNAVRIRNVKLWQAKSQHEGDNKPLHFKGVGRWMVIFLVVGAAVATPLLLEG